MRLLTHMELSEWLSSVTQDVTPEAWIGPPRVPKLSDARELLFKLSITCMRSLLGR